VGGARVERVSDPVTHLRRGLVRERERQDRVRRHAALDETRDSGRDDARFAASGAREDEQRAVAVLHGLALPIVQLRHTVSSSPPNAGALYSGARPAWEEISSATRLC